MMETRQCVSPSNSMKLNNLKAARRIKNGSPKIQEILRQRCRQRMHERRNELFTKRRPGLINFSEEEKETLTDIVRQEFENIASMEWAQAPKSLQSNNLFNFQQQTEPFLDEDETFEIEEQIEEQWIIEEYQKMLWEQKQILSMCADDDVICPICLKCFLHQVSNSVICECGLQLPVQGGLKNLKQSIQAQVNGHSAICLGVPKFSVFQDIDNVSLCLTCMSCDIFALV